MRILTLDLETEPNVAHTWGLFKQNIGLNQLMESSTVICFAAKWYGEKEVLFYSDFHDGHDVMVQKAHDLISEADAVVHYNGTSFDMPNFNREFLKAGLAPPSPYKNIDLLSTARKHFRFTSNKLQYVSQFVGLKGKTSHEGHGLWVRCMAGDEKAWALMRKYNMNDVVITEKLYKILLPWISGHPSAALRADSDVPTCTRCGSEHLQKRGFAFTDLGAFQQFQCQGCKSWLRSGKRHHAVDIRGVS